MKEVKLGQEPAYPFFEANASGYGNTVVVDTPTGRLYLPFQSGVSKRFYAACAAMQGILAGSIMDSVINISDAKDIPRDTVVATMAYEFADELLKQENQ
jgi:hypothetical protein